MRLDRSSTSGSFIRPTAQGLSLGRSLLEALYEKYTGQPQIEKDAVSNGQPGQPEMIMLGSSNGAIRVEAVDLAKVRRKFARLDRLKEVGLEAEGISTLSAPNFAAEGTGNANEDVTSILARTCPSSCVFFFSLPAPCSIHPSALLERSTGRPESGCAEAATPLSALHMHRYSIFPERD